MATQSEFPNIHPFTHRRRGKATASLSGEVRVRRLAQGHLDTQLGGSGDRTSNLPVTVQPALPPEPHQKGTEPQRTPEHTHLIPSYLFLAVTTGTPGVPLPSNELHLKRLLIGNDWLWRKSGEHDLWRVKTPLSNQGICSKLNYISVLIIHINRAYLWTRHGCHQPRIQGGPDPCWVQPRTQYVHVVCALRSRQDLDWVYSNPTEEKRHDLRPQSSVFGLINEDQKYTNYYSSTQLRAKVAVRAARRTQTQVTSGGTASSRLCAKRTQGHFFLNSL